MNSNSNNRKGMKQDDEIEDEYSDEEEQDSDPPI